jgi:hypothetical protein
MYVYTDVGRWEAPDPMAASCMDATRVGCWSLSCSCARLVSCSDCIPKSSSSQTKLKKRSGNGNKHNTTHAAQPTSTHNIHIYLKVPCGYPHHSFQVDTRTPIIEMGTPAVVPGGMCILLLKSGEDNQKTRKKLEAEMGHH